MAETMTYSGVLVIEYCCNCSMAFAMPGDFQRRMRDNPGPDGLSFCCPQGHRQYYTGKTEEQKLRERLAREEQAKTRLRSRLDQANADAAHQAAVARGYKGALVKTKRRIGKGVCPCCNRHFADVERHMASKHPDMAE
jgi:hypothetical protein